MSKKKKAPASPLALFGFIGTIFSAAFSMAGALIRYIERVASYTWGQTSWVSQHVRDYWSWVRSLGHRGVRIFLYTMTPVIFSPLLVLLFAWGLIRSFFT